MKTENAIGYFADTPFIKKGEYLPTELDKKKERADILIQSVDGDYFTIFTKGLEIKPGRGVRRYQNGTFAVTEFVLNKLRKKYNVLCDF